jgi:hypothetical protein
VIKVKSYEAMNDDEEDARRGVEELPRRDIEMHMTANESITIICYLQSLASARDGERRRWRTEKL